MTEWYVKHGNDLLSLIIFFILFHPIKNLKMWYINFVVLIQSKSHSYITMFALENECGGVC